MSSYVSQFGEEGVKTYKNYLAVISHVSSVCKEITIRMSGCHNTRLQAIHNLIM